MNTEGELIRISEQKKTTRRITYGNRTAPVNDTDGELHLSSCIIASKNDFVHGFWILSSFVHLPSDSLAIDDILLQLLARLKN